MERKKKRRRSGGAERSDAEERSQLLIHSPNGLRARAHMCPSLSAQRTARGGHNELFAKAVPDDLLAAGVTCS